MDDENLNQQTVDQDQQQVGQADGHVGQTEPTTDLAPGSDQDLTGGAPGSDGVAGDDEQSSEDEVV